MHLLVSQPSLHVPTSKSNAVSHELNANTTTLSQQLAQQLSRLILTNPHRQTAPDRMALAGLSQSSLTKGILTDVSDNNDGQ